MSREELRTTFGRVAELYDRVRPAYPASLIDRVAALGPRILEVGPGTGQATRALVERGASVTAVELAPSLGALARRNVPEAEVVQADFESWEPEAAGFDAVVAFTAFHWLSEDAKYAKPRRLLRAGGALAVVETVHVRDDDPFWVDVQDDYDAVVPDAANGPPPLPEDVGDLRGELEAHGYVHVEAHRYPDQVAYSAREFRALLSSYSPHIARDPETTRELLDRIERRVAARPGGMLVKPYLYVLTTGRTPAV